MISSRNSKSKDFAKKYFGTIWSGVTMKNKIDGKEGKRGTIFKNFPAI